MNKKNQKFRINQNIKPSNNKQEVMSVGTFFSKAFEAIKKRASTTYSKLQSKLTQTPSVVVVPHKEIQQKEVLITDIAKEKDLSLNKHSESDKERSKSNLSNADQLKIKHLMMRKQQLMEKLRKIDYDLMNPSVLPITRQANQSRISYESPLKQMQSRMKIHHDQTYNAVQHQKTIEMLARINNQKIRRQEKIVSDMKKKQQKQIKKLIQIENKSALQINRHAKVNAAKFNIRQTEDLPYDRKTNTITQSNPKALDKVENQFDGLPQLITRQQQQNFPSLVTKGQQPNALQQNDPLDPRNQ